MLTKTNKITKLESSANLENKKQKTWNFFKKKRNTDFLYELESLCLVVTRHEVNRIFFSCEHNKFLGFWFCCEWLSTFYMLMIEIILSLFINNYNDSFKETCELGQEDLFVFVSCGIDQQQAMNGLGNYDIEWRYGE